MPFAAAAPIIASLVGGGLGIAGGMINGKPKTSTQTSSSTPTLSPEMQALQAQLMAYSQEQMQDPSKGFAPIRQVGLDNINRSFMSAPSRVSSQLASRGYGSSGDVGGQLYRTELGRAGAMSDFEGQLAQAQIQQKNVGAGLSQNLLNSATGRTSTGSSTGPDTSMGDGLMSGGNAMQDLARMLTFNNFLKSPGSSSGYGNMNTSGGGSGIN